MVTTVPPFYTSSDVSDVDSCPVELQPGTSKVTPVIEKHHAALLMLLGFCGFSVLVALGHKALRKYVFKDSHSLDTVFDAGGRVSLSLTAVTVTSQFLWPGDFLLSSTLISKSGIGGALWFTLVTVIDMLMFPILSLKLKTRAPGAKTFPQIVYARFGKGAHIVFCIVALTCNLVVTSSLLLAGKSAIEVLVKDVSNEFVMLVLAVLFGSYCMIGGLGTTFYISYFNTALTFLAVSVFILKTSFFSSPEVTSLVSKEATYAAMTCIKGPEGNYEDTFMTFRTRSGLMFGVILLFMATSVSFCDQANWQSRIAAKPAQGVLGFIIGAFLWFALPTAISLTVTMAYYSLSFQNGTHLLGQADIDNGYITPYIMETLLGEMGGYLLLTMLLMALMSTGSGEVMSISSIIVYDIYKTHINPYREVKLPTSCMLCGEDKANNDCACPTSLNCKSCENDQIARDAERTGCDVRYTCAVHGGYRHYEDQLMQYKGWCMVWIVILIVPYGLVLVESGMNLTWASMAAQVFTSPFLSPIFFTVAWSRVTARGVVAGGICGVLCGFCAMCVVGSTYEGGLSDFFVNTSKDYSMMAGLVGGLVVSTVIAVLISLCTNKTWSDKEAEKEWAKTMSIDNPLNPYRAVYKEELDAINVGNAVTSKDMAQIFSQARKVAYIGGSLSIGLFLVAIPAVVLSYGVLTESQFSTWMYVCQIWCFVATVFVIIVPPVEEAIQIWRAFTRQKEETDQQDNLRMIRI